MRWSGCPGLKTIFHQALEEGLLMVRGFGPVVAALNFSSILGGCWDYACYIRCKLYQ